MAAAGRLPDAVILDTNVFVAAGFNDDSASRRILDLAEEGALRLVWNDATRRETQRILRRIPPLRWERFAGLFGDENRRDDALDLDRYGHVTGRMDRVFLALAEATDTPLVSSDSHLLEVRDRARVPVLTPAEYLRRVEVS